MGLRYNESDFHPLCLDRDHLRKIEVYSSTDLELHLKRLSKEHQAHWLIGGYLEHRDLYKSTLFDTEKDEMRNIHLGIDIWGRVNAPIYAPIEGCIHSFAYNGLELDYGYTVILEHKVEDKKTHTLYGHLSSEYFNKWKLGEVVEKGEVIGKIGASHENGGWLPHLHFQMINDMEGKHGDYPGVCSPSKKSYYEINCPDPSVLIKK